MVSVTTELLMEMVRILVWGVVGAAEVCKVVGSGDVDLVVGLSVETEGGGAVELLTLADDVGAEPPWVPDACAPAIRMYMYNFLSLLPHLSVG